MQIKELDPNKRYFIIIENEDCSQADLNAVSERLRGLDVDAVVLAGGATVRYDQEYWGIYFPQSKEWLKEVHGRLIFYPSEHVAQAHQQEYVNRCHSEETERPVARQFDECVVEEQQLSIAK